MGIQDLIRLFLPKEDHFYDYLEKQAKAAHDGAQALAKFTDDGHRANDVATAVQKIEHLGDGFVHDMEEALAKTFVTPIDREDLQKLSSELDGVLDLTNGAIRACVMMGVEKPTDPMRQLGRVLLRSTEMIQGAVPLLRKHQYEEIVRVAREIRKVEKEGDTIYREAVSELFKVHSELTDPGIDPRILIREKTVLEDLENAIDQCDAIADTLANLAVKHG